MNTPEYFHLRQQYAEKLLNAYRTHHSTPTIETRDSIRKLMSASYDIIHNDCYQDLITVLEAIEVTTKGFSNLSDRQHQVLEDGISLGLGTRILSYERYRKWVRMLRQQQIPIYPTTEILSE